jgi:hypothetical protein
MQALSKFCCQNKRCPDYGRRDANNLSVCGRFGKNNHIRLLYCRICKKGFGAADKAAIQRVKIPSCQLPDSGT